MAPPSGALIVSYDSKSRKDEAELVRKQRCRRLYLPDLVLSYILRAAIYCHSLHTSANQTTEGHTHKQTLTYTQRHATVDLQTRALGTQHTNYRCVLSLQEGLWQSLFSTSKIYTLSYAKLQFTVKHGRMESVCNKAISGRTAQISSIHYCSALLTVMKSLRQLETIPQQVDRENTTTFYLKCKLATTPQASLKIIVLYSTYCLTDPGVTQTLHCFLVV